MQRFIFLLVVLSGTYGSLAQQVYIETGRNSSSFDFTNNSGANLENLQSKTFSYVAAGYRHQLFTEGLNLTTGLSYNTYGAIGSNAEFLSSFEWDLHYLALDLGLDYDLFSVNSFTFYLHAGVSAELMLSGVQTIDNQVIDVKNIEEFDDLPIFLRGGAGLRLPLSDTANIYAQYNYGSGLVLDDNNNSATTELRIKLHSVGVGILVDLPCKTKEDAEEASENEL